MRKISKLLLALCAWVVLAGNAFAVAPENGWWWNPIESGSGYAIERQGNSIFMAAFLYETSGAATWYATLLTLQPDGSYKGDMTRYVGGKSLLGSYKSPSSTTVVATANASFPKPDMGTMTISFPNGAPTRTIPISRFAFASPSFEPSKGNFQSGWWWNDQESGTGYFIEAQGTSAFIASFMYDTSGQPTWYASLSSLTGTNVLSGALDIYANGQALGGTYKAPTASAGAAGSMSYAFTNDAVGNMTLPNSSMVAIKRFAFDPVAVTNHAPVPNAGANQIVTVGDTVNLTGTGTDTDGDNLTFSWRLLTAPTGSTTTTLNAWSTAKASFVADVAGTYRLELIADDGKVSNGGSVVSVTANTKATANIAPVANAGPNQYVSVGVTVNLNGSASSDANGDPLTYSWIFISKPMGSAATLSVATTASPSFTADVAGNYVIGLNVNDGRYSSTPSSVSVTAIAESILKFDANVNVTGLVNGESLILQFNGASPFLISSNGSLKFTATVQQSANYAITVGVQPIGQVCMINNGVDAYITTDFKDISVNCYVPGTNKFTNGTNVGYINGAATYQFSYTNGSSATFTWNADYENVSTTLKNGMVLNQVVKASSLIKSVASDGITTTATWTFPSEGWYNQNKLVTTDFSKGPVYTIPSDITKIKYPDSYIIAGNPSEYKLSDACNLNLMEISYPQSYLGSTPLPTINGAPLNSQISRGANIKDIWSANNPSSTEGCSQIGGARVEFLKLLTRFKDLNIDVVRPGVWTGIQVQSNGSWKILNNAPFDGSISDADFAWITKQAHSAGFKITWTNQIGPFYDIKNNGLATPSNTPEDFKLFMEAYYSYMLGRAAYLQSIGADTMMIDCYCYANRPTDKSSTLLYQSTLEKIITDIKLIYSGKLLMTLDPVIKNSQIILNNIDFFEIDWGFASYGGLPANTTATPSISSLIQVGEKDFNNRLSGYDLTKKYVVQFGAPSRSNFSGIPSIEETMCTTDPTGKTNDPCWQRTIATDYAQQANLYEAFYEMISKQIQVNIVEIGSSGFFLTNNIIPTTVFENIGLSPRNKPAESIIKAWNSR